MIVDRVLTAAERKSAQNVLRDHAVLSAFAGGCGSETLLMLFAISLGVSDAILSATGSLTYFSYLFLPLGFKLTARVGAVKSIGNFLFVSGLLYLMITISGFTRSAWLMIMMWVILHLCRSCSASMFFPLQKNISTEEERPGMLAKISSAGMVTGLCLTLLTAWLLSVFPHKVLLPVLFILACFFNILNSFNIRRIIEPAALKRMANHTVIKQAMMAWRLPILRRQIYVGSAMNLFLAMVPPMNVLVMKQGYHLPNSSIMILVAVQTISAIIALRIYKKLTLKFGPAEVLVRVCPLTWLLFLYWIFAPKEISLLTAMPPFILSGALAVVISTGLGNYFTNTVGNTHQVGGTFWVFVITGGAMGVIGMVMNPLILKMVQFCGAASGIGMYRWYFVITALLFACLIYAPKRLVNTGK